MTTVLVTGATGYLGSHACVELLRRGYEIVGIDNLTNSHPGVVDRIVELAGRPFPFLPLDVRHRAALDAMFERHPIDAVIHFAGLKAVAASVTDPMAYYHANVAGTLTLLQAMHEHGVARLVFSSSCTVYGDPDPAGAPVTERSPLRPVSPYGWSKLMAETMLRHVVATDDRWRVICLRYFNPIGAHPSGRLGEHPVGRAGNLLPVVMDVACGQRRRLQIFGGDHPTPDGTCVRDYIHVMDLIRGHLLALDRLHSPGGWEVFNLGTGVGWSVLDVVAAAEEVAGVAIPYEIVERRAGDASAIYADAALAATRLGWQAELDLWQMCADHWRWHHQSWLTTEPGLPFPPEPSEQLSHAG